MKKSMGFILIIFMALTLFPVGYLDEFSILFRYLYNYGTIFTTFILVILYLKNNKLNFNHMLFLSYFVILILSLFLNNKNIFSSLSMIATSINVYFFIDYGYKYNYRFNKILENILYIYVLINFLTIIFFPNGLIYDNNGVPCWFFGQKNLFILYCFPAILLSLINNYKRKKNISLKTKIILIISWISIYISDSKTSLIAITVLLLSLIFKRILSNTKIFNIKNYAIFSFILLILIVFFRIQNHLSFFIVDVLNKDITLTNRVYIWDIALNLFKNKLFFGYGKLDLIAVQFSNYIHYVYHCHNYFLQVLIDTGIVGTSIFYLNMFFSFRQVYKYRNNEIAKILSLILFCYLIMMITEYYSYVFIFFLFSICYNIKTIISNMEER